MDTGYNGEYLPNTMSNNYRFWLGRKVKRKMTNNNKNENTIDRMCCDAKC